VIATGFSDHYAQTLQVQMQYKNKKRQAIVKEEFRIVRSCREENVQYLNYLLEKKAWELVFNHTLQLSIPHLYWLKVNQYTYHFPFLKQHNHSRTHSQLIIAL
jgi:hypothetical protein